MIPDSSTLQGVLEPIVSPATCSKKNGAISLAVRGSSPPLQYRIHDREFGREQAFKGLAPGVYPIEVKNEDGCTLRSQVEIKNIGALAISGVELSPALCQTNNGQIKLKLSGAIGAISYSLDSSFQAPLTQLVGLSGGNYQVYVRDSVCQQDTLLRVRRDTLVNFSIQNIRVSPERCNGQDGKMVVETGGKTSGLTYLIGGLSFRNSTIEGLSKGLQILIVQDSNGCQISRKVEIPSEAQSIQELAYSSTSNSCNQPEASLQLQVTKGGLPPFQFALQDSSQFQFSPNFEGIRPGKYLVWVKDQSQCPAKGLTLNIERKDCKVFVPNVFSPNQDKKNDFFRIMAPEGLVKMVRSFQVFDRWGALVYRATPNIDFANFDGWNGEVRGSRAAQGPYLYTIELEYHDGFEKLSPILRGTVQVLW
jgi:gliding motility-associated-like protein